ncbi:MAG: acyl-CoA synthetase [Gammaproteobacteria bacterium]|nr:MAG: acyl-CoA synthetase [Gammaproteobacteria bacterium]
MTAAQRWNFGDIYDAMGEAVDAAAPCLIQGDRVLTWGDYTRRTNNLARVLRERGIESGDKVGFYLRNHPAYMEMLGACFKGRFTHVNVNYRYVDEELHYIFDNSDSKVVLYGEEFAEHVAALKPRLPKVALWLEISDDGSVALDGSESFEALAESGNGAPLGIERSPDDMLFIYTGGTTGMPKGVMWGLEDLWFAGAAGATPATDMLPPATLEAHAANVRKAGGGSRMMPCCPLMHGTGLLTSMACLAGGGSLVLLEKPSFDPVECLEAVQRWQVNGLAIVGDAFAKPLQRALEEASGRYELASLVSIISSGVMWSMEVKRGLLEQHPGMVLTDSFGASEAVGFGRSDTTVDGTVETARFVIGEHCKVFTEDGREVQPGDPEPGFIARTGAIPKGYYKDLEKTAKTFPTIDGVRYSMPGDWCRVEADGSLILLGRGSVCINTAGEKVYPEEVEEVLKQHPDVEDALVVGVPDEKWGQMVTAVVQLQPGAALDEDALKVHARKHLAGYKTPKRILDKANLGRASNGKADYKGITAFAKAELGLA